MFVSRLRIEIRLNEDESLNSLDYKTKTKILENIKKLNKTIILISHDENDLKVCDSILDMNNFK